MIPIITGLRSAPSDWVARLREVDPIRDAVSYLELVWYDTAERWVLYEMVPVYDYDHRPTVDLQILSELKGVDPTLIPETAPLISRRQWLLYQQTGRWARPSWCIQGSKGGHLVAYDSATQELLRRTGRPDRPPAPGDLPYAPFDERVVTQILRMSKLTQARNDLDEFRRQYAGEGGKRKYKEALRDARAQQLAWLDSQMDEAAELFVSAYRKGEFDAVGAPLDETDWVKKDTEESENFISTGSFGQQAD